MPFRSKTTFLDDDEVYDIIADVVGDETSHEFCALVDYYIEDRDLTAALQMNGLSQSDFDPLREAVEERAEERVEAR